MLRYNVLLTKRWLNWDLKTNILSMGQLTKKGYSIFLKDRLLHLKN